MIGRGLRRAAAVAAAGTLFADDLAGAATAARAAPGQPAHTHTAAPAPRGHQPAAPAPHTHTAAPAPALVADAPRDRDNARVADTTTPARVQPAADRRHPNKAPAMTRAAPRRP